MLVMCGLINRYGEALNSFGGITPNIFYKAYVQVTVKALPQMLGSTKRKSRHSATSAQSMLLIEPWSEGAAPWPFAVGFTANLQVQVFLHFSRARRELFPPPAARAKLASGLFLQEFIPLTTSPDRDNKQLGGLLRALVSHFSTSASQRRRLPRKPPQSGRIS